MSWFDDVFLLQALLVAGYESFWILVVTSCFDDVFCLQSPPVAGYESFWILVNFSYVMV